MKKTSSSAVSQLGLFLAKFRACCSCSARYYDGNSNGICARFHTMPLIDPDFAFLIRTCYHIPSNSSIRPFADKSVFDNRHVIHPP